MKPFKALPTKKERLLGDKTGPYPPRYDTYRIGAFFIFTPIDKLMVFFYTVGTADSRGFSEPGSAVLVLCINPIIENNPQIDQTDSQINQGLDKGLIMPGDQKLTSPNLLIKR